MRNVWTITKRELGAYLRSPLGYIVCFAVLVIDGLLFNAVAMGGKEQKSSDVLEMFFYTASGTTLIGAVFIAMRLIAEERQNGTWVLLATAPIRDWQVILGKFSSALIFLGGMTALTFYMPLLVMVNGKVSWGHIVGGYVGLLLIGGAALAIGVLCSALAPNQLIAAVSSAAAITVFVLMWMLSRIASPPLDEILANLSLHDKHFRPFMRGLISTQDVVFYVSLMFVSLTLATRVIESRRWQ